MGKYDDMMMEMLRYMKSNNASDLHITAAVRPYARIHGKIIQTQFSALPGEECRDLLFSFLTEEGKKAFYELKTLDFPYGSLELGRFRINIYQQRGTIAAAIRRLPIEIPPLEELGLPLQSIKDFCNRSNGLVLVCGSTGSGKTTTMASMVDYINKTRCCHIISIEDPIEYIFKNDKSLIHQREVRRDTNNFIDALKYILREDPDVVVIGEMSDLETIVAALTIAETGHLVFATLHTGDTSESIRRIVDVFPSTQQAQISLQLSYTLLGVVNQSLLPICDGSGRILASEVMAVTPAIQNLIRENKVEQIYSHIQMGTDYGMQTMGQSLFQLVSSGKVSREMALSKTKRDKELVKLLEG
jgi:twitching motility protein PilT